MTAAFLLTVITRLAQSHAHPSESGIHTIFAILIIFPTLIHIVINRKSLAKHLSGPVRKTD
jgi:hypothetical protein